MCMLGYRKKTMGFIVSLLFMAAAAAALFVVGGRLKKADKKLLEESKNDEYGRVRRPSYLPLILRSVGGVVAVVTVLLVGFTSFYTQDPGEAVVVKSFTGKIVNSTPDAGMHVKAPWDSTVTFNIRNQPIAMYSNAGGEGADGAALSVPLKGGANASVSITIAYSINSASVESIYNQFKDQQGLKDTALKPQLRNIVRNETAKLAPLEVKEKRAQLGTNILTALAAEWAKYGVVVDQVNLGDITLDQATEQAISKVITAQQEVEQARANLSKAKITAEVTKTEAKAQADSDQIMRCGAQTTEVEVTDPVTGKKDTEMQVTPIAMDKCQNRLNEQVLTNKYIDALKEIASKQGNVIITDGKTVPMVQVPQAAK